MKPKHPEADYSAVLTADQVRQIRVAAELAENPKRFREWVALLAASHEALRAATSPPAAPLNVNGAREGDDGIPLDRPLGAE